MSFRLEIIVTNKLTNIVYAATRFTSVGAIDTTFGDPTTPGQTILDFYGVANTPTSIQLVLDSLGNPIGFIVAGWVSQSTGQFTSNNYWGLARYTVNGSLNTTFGSNGGFVIDFGSQNTQGVLPSYHQILVQSDGRVVMAGTAKFSSGTYAGYNFALARFWP
jgi:hypothetical protein